MARHLSPLAHRERVGRRVLPGAASHHLSVLISAFFSRLLPPPPTTSPCLDCHERHDQRQDRDAAAQVKTLHRIKSSISKPHHFPEPSVTVAPRTRSLYLSSDSDSVLTRLSHLNTPDPHGRCAQSQFVISSFGHSSQRPGSKGLLILSYDSARIYKKLMLEVGTGVGGSICDEQAHYPSPAPSSFTLISKLHQHCINTPSRDA